MILSPKVQDIFHWITIIILWIGSIIPLINSLVNQHLSGQALVFALITTGTSVYNLFNYYAKNTVGTTPPPTPTI